MQEEHRNNLIMRAIYRKQGKIFYFDNNGIYSSIPVIDVPPNLLKGIFFGEDNFPTILTSHIEYGCTNGHIAAMALARLHEGDTIERFEELLSTCKPAPKNSHKPQGIDAFICRIDNPIFYRSSNNINAKTFDYIYIDVSIVSNNTMKNRDEYLKEHIGEIRQRVVEKLAKSGKFKKYGIPINFLRICRTTLKRTSNVLQFVFELKLQ